jgi:hypothetical protein
VLGRHVQQSGLSEAALRAYEAERARRVRAVFSMANRHAAAMAAGEDRQRLFDERAALLYGEANFAPLGAAAVGAGAAA